MTHNLNCLSTISNGYFLFFYLNRWVVIYPAYIDSSRTRATGRRVPKNRSVDKPTIVEIYDVLTAANMKAGLEPKFYPRENSKEEEQRGRVRVQLKNDDGTPVNPAFPNRTSSIQFMYASASLFFFFFFRWFTLLVPWRKDPSSQEQSVQNKWRWSVCWPGRWSQEQERQRWKTLTIFQKFGQDWCYK